MLGEELWGIFKVECCIECEMGKVAFTYRWIICCEIMGPLLR
jgi:hypothetical protein